ncbi:hypothetical protein CHUAL_006581 [Chamberlinius hualienensis]
MTAVRLGTVDYLLIVGLLVFSLAVGIYKGVKNKRNDSRQEYFLANRGMNVFQTSCSLFATIISSGMIIGVIAENYYYGFHAMFAFAWFIPMQYLVAKLFLPVFYNIGSPDIYAYHELRYNRHLRYFLSIFTVIEKAFVNSVAIYVAGTILNTFTDINIWISSITLTILCILYSSMGGVRGVTIADTIQSFIIIGSVFAILFLGLYKVGGIVNVWERSWESGRLTIFNFDFNPTTRHTFWSSTIGTFFFTMGSLATSQTHILRVLTCKSIKDCQKASIIGTSVAVAVIFLMSIIGLLIYAAYYLCDPLTDKKIKSSNELLSYFISNKLSNYTGFQGIFLAGFICAAVSTLSSALNAVSATIMESVIKPFKLIKNEKSYTKVAKSVVVIHGLLSLCGIIVVGQFPNVYQALRTILSVMDGPHLGLLLIGMFFPRGKVISAIGGLSSGVIFMSWVLLGAMLTKQKSATLPLSTAGCPIQNFTSPLNNSISSNWTSHISLSYNETLNETGTLLLKSKENKWNWIFPLSSVSFAWYTALGTIVTIFAFAIISLITGAEKQREINHDLIPIPIQNFHRKLNSKMQRILLCDVYGSNRSNKPTTDISSEIPLVNKPDVADEHHSNDDDNSNKINEIQ